MNTANKLTMLRILIIPIYFVMMSIGSTALTVSAGILFILAAATDTLDGYIARKYDMVTDFGKFTDPLADKMLVLTAMVFFTSIGRIPAWGVVIVIMRELAITSLRTLAANSGTVLAADKFGKIKTASQLVALSAMHFEQLLPIDGIADVVFYFSVFMTVLSGVNYLVKNRALISEK